MKILSWTSKEPLGWCLEVCLERSKEVAKVMPRMSSVLAMSFLLEAIRLF